jgi:hypothetical protein
VRYSAGGREQLIREHAQSGLTKKEFCARQQINLNTFYTWSGRKSSSDTSPKFAQVELAASSQASVEVLLVNGTRIGIRHHGKREELVALIRGVAGC